MQEAPLVSLPGTNIPVEIVPAVVLLRLRSGRSGRLLVGAYLSPQQGCGEGADGKKGRAAYEHVHRYLLTVVRDQLRPSVSRSGRPVNHRRSGVSPHRWYWTIATPPRDGMTTGT